MAMCLSSKMEKICKAKSCILQRLFLSWGIYMGYKNVALMLSKNQNETYKN